MKHLKLASKKALLSSFSRAKMGAVIVKSGRVLSTGVNNIRYSKHNKRTWASVHAEEQAIVSLLKQPEGIKQLVGSTLYISRVMKDGSTGLAKPCEDCQKLINAVGIKKGVHT